MCYIDGQKNKYSVASHILHAIFPSLALSSELKIVAERLPKCPNTLFQVHSITPKKTTILIFTVKTFGSSSYMHEIFCFVA
jgi:hypothetical protein